jgi:hypothetical protein
MKRRCQNPRVSEFKYYGGRGIKVCDRWQIFSNFLADMGEAPDGLSIDRFPDVNGNYEPGNCRWTTMKEQNRNRRFHVLLTHDGKTQCLSAWAEELGVNESRLRWHLKAGMDFEAALKTVRERKPRGRRQVVAKRPKINPSGFPGVRRSLDKWTARIVIGGERRHLGTFETAEAAAEAYRNIKESLNKSAGV